MADFDELRPEVQQFLRDRASALDHDAVSVDAEEAEHRVVTHTLEPSRRWRRTPATIAIGARRQPALAAAVVAALLVGTVGGFAAGRGSAPSHASVAARGATQDKTTASTIVTNRGFAMATGGNYDVGQPVMQRLFIRTTADGVTLRGYLQSTSGPIPQPMCAPNEWCPPPECNPTTYFMAELSNAEAVMQTGSPQLPLEGPAANRAEAPFGQAEGSPVSAWVLQANDQVTSVRAVWSDGAVDEMTPVQGWAVVAHTGSGLPNTIEAVLADGSTVSLKDANNSYPASCQPPPPPPPELPPAGSEQPADVAAATQDVTAAYEYVFTAGNDPSNNGTYIEDAESVKSAADQVKQNFPQATETVSVEVGEIRFLSATEAALFFELKYDGGALFGQQIGYAKFIDGRWKIERDTMCMVLGWGGGQCDPPPDPARSTSAGSAPQPGTYSGPSSNTATTSAVAPTTAPN